MTHKRKGQHFTKRTVSATRWCNKCRKMTPHRVDDGRPGGPCLECMEQSKAKGGAHDPTINAADSQSRQTDLRAAGDGRAFLWVPMACFCTIYAFPHHHAEGEIRAQYPGPLVVQEFERLHGLVSRPERFS